MQQITIIRSTSFQTNQKHNISLIGNIRYLRAHYGHLNVPYIFSTRLVHQRNKPTRNGKYNATEHRRRGSTSAPKLSVLLSRNGVTTALQRRTARPQLQQVGWLLHGGKSVCDRRGFPVCDELQAEARILQKKAWCGPFELSANGLRTCQSYEYVFCCRILSASRVS